MKKMPVVLGCHAGRMLCAGLLLSVASTVAAADDNCQRLEALHRQYIGVVLTSDQKKLKRKLVAWYRKNCRPSHRVRAGR
jgi:hypothetical protein